MEKGYTPYFNNLHLKVIIDGVPAKSRFLQFYSQQS